MLKTQSLVRIRPALGNELLLPHTLQLDTDDRTVSVMGSRGVSLTCDRVLSPGFTQQLVFNATIQPMIDDSLLEDRVPVLFILGPHHGGKSYTVEGNQNDDALAGVLYNSISYLFANDAAEVYVSSLGFGPMERIKNLLTPSEYPQDVTPLFNQRAYPSVTYPCCAYSLTQASDIVDLVRLSRRHAARMEQTDWVHKMWILDYQIQGQYGRFVTVELALFPSPRSSDLLLAPLLVRVMSDIRAGCLDVLPIRESKLLSCLRDSFHAQFGSITFLLCISQVTKQEDLESNLSLLYSIFPYTKDSIPSNKALVELINSKGISPHASQCNTLTATKPVPGTSDYYAEVGERYKESCKEVSLNYVKEQLQASNRILQSIVEEGQSPAVSQAVHSSIRQLTEESPHVALGDSTSALAATHTSITATPQVLRHDRVLARLPTSSLQQVQMSTKQEQASHDSRLEDSLVPDPATAVIAASKVTRESGRLFLSARTENRPLNPELARAPARPTVLSPSTFDDSLVPQTVAMPVRSVSAQTLRRVPSAEPEPNLQLTPVQRHVPATPSSAIHLGKTVATGASLTAHSINFERDQQLEQLRRKDEDTTRRLHEMELDLKKKTSQLRQMELLLKDALQQNESHLIKMESMGKTIDELRDRPQVTVHQLDLHEREEYEKQIAALNNALVQKDDEIHSLHVQAEKLRGLLNQSTKFQAYADSLGTTLEPSQQLLDERVEAMLVDLASRDKQITDLTRENDEVQQLLHKMRGDLVDHERVIGDLGYYKGLSAELGNMRTTLSAEIEQLKAENEVFRLENQHLHDEMGKMREDRSAAQMRAVRAEEATESVADLSQRYVELERKYEDVVRENRSARTEAASKDATIESLSRQVGYLKGIERTLTHISGAMSHVPMDATVRAPMTSSGFNPGNHPRELDILSNNISEIHSKD